MARRIALTVIALVVVLLGIVAVPLGLHVASEDRKDFVQQTAAAAAAVATVAEESLDDHSGASLAQVVADVRRQGDRVAIYQQSGGLIAGDRSIAGLSAGLVTIALTGAIAVAYPTADRLLVVAPVHREENATSIGAVALSRSTESLDHRIRALWAWLALASAAGLAAAALTATALARWVSSPLAGLEVAARRLGAGEFDARSPGETGPREVRRLAATFNMMAGRLDALVTGNRAMMADVSHQLRTPLAALRLRLDVLALAAPKSLVDELAGAQVEVARLSRMVDGLLAVARAENVTSAPVPVAVDAVISDRIAAWLPTAAEKPVHLRVLAGEPVTASLGEGHLEQILDNLLANAIEAVPVGGHVHISASHGSVGHGSVGHGSVGHGSVGHGGADHGSAGRVSRTVRIVVADDGPGMSTRQRRAALHRYATATPGGTGLGLAIVHRLVTSDGGTVELSETPGGGLTATLTVPAVARERSGWRS